MCIDDYWTNSNTVPQVQCQTAAATAAKVGTITNFSLLSNSYVMVNMRYANQSATAITLNLNSTGAKPIYINGSASSTSNHTLPAGSYLVYYNGTNFYFRTDGKITGDITGNAATATALGSNAGSTSLPVYFTGGKPSACTATQAAASGGTTLTLVTTGEKYTWNNKSNLAIGTTATTAASGNHAHPCSIATNSGTNSLTMAASTKYKLTAGGSQYIFTTPPDTKYTAATAAPGNIASSGSAGSSANYARQDHTHGIALATGDSNGQVKIAGSNVSVKGLAAAAYKAVDTKPASGSANLVTSGGVHSRIAFKKFTLTAAGWQGPYYDSDRADMQVYRQALNPGSQFTVNTIIVSVNLYTTTAEEFLNYKLLYQVEPGASYIEFRAKEKPGAAIDVVVGYVNETLDTVSTQASIATNTRFTLVS